MSGDDSTPREVGGSEGAETLGAPTASRSQLGDDRRGRVGGDKNPPSTRPNWEQLTDSDNGAAPRGTAAMADKETEAKTEKGSGGAGRLTAHSTGAALSAAEGGPVSGARAGQGGETNGAGYSPAHSTAAAQAPPEEV